MFLLLFTSLTTFIHRIRSELFRICPSSLNFKWYAVAFNCFKSIWWLWTELWTELNWVQIPKVELNCELNWQKNFELNCELNWTWFWLAELNWTEFKNLLNWHNTASYTYSLDQRLAKVRYRGHLVKGQGHKAAILKNRFLTIPRVLI